jgi:hypothetical protein
LKSESVYNSIIRALTEKTPVRIYLQYGILNLKELRALLNDFESVYNNLERSRINEPSASGQSLRKFPLRVDEMHTGNSISMDFIGNTISLAQLGQILSFIHQHWETLGAAGLVSLPDYAKKYLEMKKIAAETRKLNAETELRHAEIDKTKAETVKAETEKAKLELESLKSAPIHSSYDREKVQPARLNLEDPAELAFVKLANRLERVSRSPRIQKMEIILDGQHFVVTKGKMTTLPRAGNDEAANS